MVLRHEGLQNAEPYHVSCCRFFAVSEQIDNERVGKNNMHFSGIRGKFGFDACSELPLLA